MCNRVSIDLIDMTNVYSMFGTLLFSLLRMINEIGVNQTSSSTVNAAYAWLATLNPIVLIIMGVIVFVAAKFAKWIGIIMVIVGLVLLALPYLGVLH